jgi:ABC-type sulfate transport system permease component
VLFWLCKQKGKFVGDFIMERGKFVGDFIYILWVLTTGRGVVLAIFYVFYPIFLRSSRETFVKMAS